MDWSSLLALAGQAAPEAGQQRGGLMDMLPIIIIIFGLFYILIIRPQKRGQQQVEDMRSAIKKGDRVKSIGGIHGTVTAVDTTNNIVSVQVDRNVKLDFDRTAIATVISKEEAKQQRKAEKESKADKEPVDEETED